MGEIYNTFSRSVTSKTAAPDNPYTHATHILENEDEEKTKLFRNILTRDLKLANIQNPQQLRFVQNSLDILVMMFSAALREPELLPTFETMYWIIHDELGLTRALQGQERRYQGGPGVGFSIRGQAPQAGGLEQYEVKQQEDENMNFFNSLLSRVRKKKQPEGQQ